jgi:hypothetical protein
MKTKAIIHYPAISMMLLMGCLYHNSIFAESFILESLPPVAVCQDVIVSADENCVGYVTADQVDNGSFDPEGDSLTYSLDLPAPYELGETTVTLTVADSTGETDQCTATITVVDDTAPVITINPVVSIMWPPNHQYTTFELDDLIISVEDNCSELGLEDVNITKVTSDEAENSTGDGNTMDDILIASDCKSIQLRSERQGSSNGRVYTIYLELDDGNDNTDSASYQIHVPHNTGNPAIDDGPAFEVYMDCNDETTSITDIDIEAVNLSVYPNPFSNSTTFEYELKQASTVQIFIYNHIGNQVDVIRIEQAKGLNKTSWNPKNKPEGVYYFKFQAADQKASGKVILMK